MHIVAVAWMFVVVLMALTEATSSQGSLLGALVTFVLYGLLPLAIVLYLMGTPVRRRARKAAEAQADAAAAADASSTPAGDGSGQAAGAGLAPVRKEP
jgi:Na+-transporting methylmalonyl-CoA/oxaloacetate decarboxylase gamma subunit